MDKLGNKKSEYALNIFDQNLNSVATKSLIESTGSDIISSAFNQKEIAFAFLTSGVKKLRIIKYNQQGEISTDNIYQLTSQEYDWLFQANSMGFTEVLTPIQNKGFIFSTVSDNKGRGIGYTLKFLPSDPELKEWEYSTPESNTNNLTLNPIYSNQDYLVAIEMAKKSKYTVKADMSLIIFDANTGEQIINRLYSKDENPKLITNSFVDNNGDFVVLGEYFKAGDDIYKDKSLGLFVEVLNTKGEMIHENKISWEGDLFKKLKEDNKDTKNNSLVYFHDIVQTQSGYYGIGEMYRKTANAAGIALSIINRSPSNLTQLTITDAVVYKFDDKFNLVDLEVFKKGKSRFSSVTDYGSPQLNAHIMKVLGAFDYINTQMDKQNDRFYANFLDYERFDNQEGKVAFTSIIQNEDKLTTDKIYLEDKKRHEIRALPAKIGYVLMLDYNKKEKKVDLHLEKLNIK